ncbi:tRNA(His) guanylyltransferase [Exophiala aquamarina CBS 119918]|uniref:tRNA(His) guanylyltransferase n=1 Tax=Exophiala aquamarina CBS 119918 TaxID=1182545 RepID=A0A072NVM1_9EURO|nr:tRNA(His) guanylyltransferase [Exophiala aquamarina CBS 119918]KEF51651.1 tRNA(His) guanylyltransferase [Exophiala aquamarina CBS 119918]
MANSKYEYVRNFERDEILLPNTWIVVRVDGRGFHKLSTHYKFTKPNDTRALNLMNAAAAHVVTTVPDLVVAYGVSDEFSFVFHRSTDLFERRAAKLVSTVVSTFTAVYVLLWSQVFSGDAVTDSEERDGGRTPSLSVEMLPTFDGRAVCYPSWHNLRDYLSWRQVDCHINNLYNTTFWAMVNRGKMTPTAAEEELKGTVAADKNEILFSRFGINYNNEPEMFRKGSVVFREYALAASPSGKDVQTTDEMSEAVSTGEEGREVLSRTQAEKMKKLRRKAKVVVRHLDIIKDNFWEQRPWLTTGKPGEQVVGSQEP